MCKTVSQTSSILPIKRNSKSGFTLIELLVSAGLSAFILVGVLTSFLMLGRVSKNIQNYTEIEATARKSLEIMSREVRSAYNVAAGYTGTSVTLMIPDSSSNRTALAYTVTYAYDASNSRITRAVNSGTPVSFVTGVQRLSSATTDDPFQYYRFNNTTYPTPGQGYVNGYSSNTVAIGSPTSAIQQIEVKFIVKRQSATVTGATNKVLSARFVIRNK